MAFRSKFRRPFRSKFRRRTPLARVRRTWVSSFNRSICAPIDVACTTVSPVITDPPQPELQCCSTGFTLVLVDQAVLDSQFSDRLTIKRVVGDLWIQPVMTATAENPDCNVLLGQFASGFHQAFVGLRRYQKDPLGVTGENPYIPRPLSGATSLERDYDLSESQWRKTWQHSWTPDDGFISTNGGGTFNMSFPVSCQDTHTSGALDNDFVDGTGTINIVTDCNPPDCVPCPQDLSTLALCGTSSRSPRPWHLHIDVRKSIPLREDQEAAIQGECVFPFASANYIGELVMWGNLRTLVQMG